MPSRSSGYCALICSFDLMILIFFGVSSQGSIGLEVVIKDSESGCCVDPDCAEVVIERLSLMTAGHCLLP